MDRWIHMTETTCIDPSREKEFNDWFDNIHVPDVLKTTGFVSARRFVIKEPVRGRGKYLAIYEIDTDDIEKTWALRNEFKKEEDERGRALAKALPNLVHITWREIFFKQISERIKS